MTLRPMGGALKHSSRDALFVLLAGVHGVLLITVPSAPLIAIMIWWNANTIAHNFIHLPFFRSRRANSLFSILLSALLGVPQTLWRDRHVAHHAERKWHFRASPQMMLDLAGALTVWTIAFANGSAFFFTTWLAGWAGGMLLCQLQGHFEHVRGTVSHYGSLYNALFFNDGYHVEHHARPGLHWSALPHQAAASESASVHSSRWPAVLRWLESSPLDALEQLVLRSKLMQNWLVDLHANAFSSLLDGVPSNARVTIVGGALFPRTVLVMRRLLPGAQIRVVDKSAENISRAREMVDDRVQFIHAEFTPEYSEGADVLVVPLAFTGDRSIFYSGKTAPVVLVHDWIWRRRGNTSAIVSPLLLKRVNRVENVRFPAKAVTQRRYHASANGSPLPRRRLRGKTLLRPGQLALSLFAVLLIAKLIAIWGRPIPLNGWTPIALAWQDVSIVLALFSIEMVARKPLISRIVYAALVMLAVANVPVERALGSPVTMQMLRATSGTIGDSFAHYASFGNIAAIALICVASIAIPVLLARGRIMLPRGIGAGLAAATALVVVTGPTAAARVDTAGFDRNELIALVRSMTTRVAPLSETADWRIGPDGPALADSHSALIGAAAKHNVLMIVLESTAAQYMRAYGASEDPTPNLTALASRSLLYENAFSVYPESVRGMTAIFASRYPAFDVQTERHARFMSPSVASLLNANGYNTALFHSGRFMYLGMDSLLARTGFDTLVDAGGVSGVVNSSFGVDEFSTVGAMLKWLDKRPKLSRRSMPRQYPGRSGDPVSFASDGGSKPFFLAYMPVAGHHPYSHEAEGPWPNDSEINRYRNALHEGDAAIGVLLDGLRARNLMDNTLIVVLADHGEAFGQHPGNFVHTLAIYDENVRVPLFFVLPGMTAQKRDARTASVMDVPPTMLHLLGIESPAEFEGVSLLAPQDRMALYFTDYSLGLLGLRDRCTSYIYQMETKRSRLYDVCRDPGQQRDISAQHERKTKVYRDILERWTAAQVANVMSAR